MPIPSEILQQKAEAAEPKKVKSPLSKLSALPLQGITNREKVLLVAVLALFAFILAQQF